MIREIEDEKARNNTDYGSGEVIAPKKEEVNLVEDYPDTPPNQDNADDNAKIFGKVTESVLFWEEAHTSGVV